MCILGISDAVTGYYFWFCSVSFHLGCSITISWSVVECSRPASMGDTNKMTGMSQKMRFNQWNLLQQVIFIYTQNVFPTKGRFSRAQLVLYIHSISEYCFWKIIHLDRKVYITPPLKFEHEKNNQVPQTLLDPIILVSRKRIAKKKTPQQELPQKYRSYVPPSCLETRLGLWRPLKLQLRQLKRRCYGHHMWQRSWKPYGVLT